MQPRASLLRPKLVHTPASLADVLARAGITGPVTVWARDTPGTWTEAWAECPSAEWVIRVASHLGVDRRRIVRAACDCVLLIFPLARRRDEARAALDAARAWVDGRADDATCWARGAAASQAADEVAEGDPHLALVLRAAASLAFACDANADLAYWATRGHAGDAAALCARASADPVVARKLAEIARGHLPADTISREVRLLLRRAYTSGLRPAVGPDDPELPRRKNARDG